MRKSLFSGYDTSQQQSSASPQVGNGNGRNRLRKCQLLPSSNAPKPPSRIPSVTSSEPDTTVSNGVAAQQPPRTPGRTDCPRHPRQRSTLYHSESQASAERARAAVEPIVTGRDTQALPSPSTRQLQTTASTSSSSGQTSSIFTNSPTKGIPSFGKGHPDPLSVFSGPPAGHLESEMLHSSLPSPSQIRKRCPTTFSIHSSTHSGIPKSSISRQPPEAALSNLLSCRSAISRSPSASRTPASSSWASPPRTPTSSQSPPSPRSSASTSNSGSSRRMLLFKRKQPKSVTYKGQKISGPFPQQDARYMGQAPGLGEDGSVSVDMWRKPPYQEIRAATPPTPVRSVRTTQIKAFGSSRIGDDSVSRSNVAMNHGIGVPESSKQPLYRSNSVQSRAIAPSAAVDTRGAITMDQKLMTGASSSIPTSSHWSSVMTTPQSPAFSRPSSLKQPGRSWSSRFASKSKSVFSSRQTAASTSSGYTQGPPPRPPRSKESIRHGPQEQSSFFSVMTSPEANNRIDSYGWQNIKPLPGRGRLMPEVADVPGPIASNSSGSAYSVTFDDGRPADRANESNVERISKHRRAAFWALDGEIRRRQKRSAPSVSSQGSNHVVDRKGKTPIRPSGSKPKSPTMPNGASVRTMSKLTAVTEEEAELHYYDTPLPAPPAASIESSDSEKVKRRQSAAILPQGEYKPWWEEQNIPDPEPDFDLNEEDNQTPDSSLEVQASSTAHSLPSTSVDAEGFNGKSSESQENADSPSKSMLLTEIARSYVDEKQRAEDRERQDRYRQQMRGARLGKQMIPQTTQPKQEVLTRGGKGKWRFSVFENEIESGPNTPKNSNSSDSGVSGGIAVTELRTAKVGASISATASVLTLPESEKAKLRPLPLRVGSVRDKRIAAQDGSMASPPTKETRSGMRKAGKRPSALSLSNTMPPRRGDIRKAATGLSEKIPISPASGSLIRRNGEVLLPSADLGVGQNPISPPLSSSSSSSSRFWSDSDHDKSGQPVTPPTGRSVGIQPSDAGTALGYRMTNNNDNDIKRETFGTENKNGSESDILDFYLDAYLSDRAPPVPKKNPRRSSPSKPTPNPVEAAGRIQLPSSSKLGKTRERADFNHPSQNFNRPGPAQKSEQHDEADEADEQRRREEDEDSQRRVARILAVLREKSVSPVSVRS